MKTLFESEVIFPKQPFEAAVLFLAVMAYPEKGAGQFEQKGSKFATALVDYCVWSTRQSHGLKWLREMRSDPNFKAPKKRQFEGCLNRGLRRIARRSAAYDLHGTQLLTGFFEVRRLGALAIQEGRPDEAYHSDQDGNLFAVKQDLWRRGTPTAKKLITSDESRWSQRLALNQTGQAASKDQKSKDLYERAYLPSIPVLHMAHALNKCAYEAAKTIQGWDHREPFSALLMNSEKWIWTAIKEAETWRRIPKELAGRTFGPDDLVQLRASTPGY